MRCYFSENPQYLEKTKRATKAPFNRKSSIGLIGERINVENGELTNKPSHIGCYIISYYVFSTEAHPIKKKIYSNNKKSISR